MNTDREQAKAYLDQLDLNYLVEMMCAEAYPLPRWTPQDALHGINLYKNFLWLHRLHPSITLVPSREIDECWHNHILYTKNYLNDCLHILGHYLHHQPATPGEDDATLAQDYLRTKELYLQEFKRPLPLIIDLSPATP